MDQFELRTARRLLAVSSGIPLVIVSKHLQLTWEDALLLEQRFVVLLRVSARQTRRLTISPIWVTILHVEFILLIFRIVIWLTSSAMTVWGFRNPG
ncbi:hypothetical protein LINPERHAP1_LOCUS17586 [Linum perenne]